MLSLGFGFLVIYAFNIIEPLMGGPTFSDPRTGQVFYVNASGLLFWLFCVIYCAFLVLIYVPHSKKKPDAPPTAKERLPQPPLNSPRDH